MEYSVILKRVSQLDFVADESEAGAMIKSVLGHLARRMKESNARQFANYLPKPLTYDKLRGQQTYTIDISFNQFAGDLERQYQISTEEVQSLFKAVLNTVKTSVPEDHIKSWAESLPWDWANAIKIA